jgi:hypothetical protein
MRDKQIEDMAKEKRREYFKQYRETHRDKIREYNKRYMEKRRYYHEVIKNNPEEMAKRAEYSAKWQRENRDKWNAYRREYYRRKKMSRDKQIKEMAELIYKETDLYNVDTAYDIASVLHDEGYRKASDVAREIFEEIEKLISSECLVIKDEDGIRGYVDASVHYILAELKKKYLGEDINAPTKESEGEG